MKRAEPNCMQKWFKNGLFGNAVKREKFNGSEMKFQNQHSNARSNINCLKFRHNRFNIARVTRRPDRKG